MSTKKTAGKSAGLAKPWWVLQIELNGVEPVVSRKVLVPASITLPKLHQVIQAAMGWENVHLHEFIIAGERYGHIFPDSFRDDVNDEKRVHLDRVLGRLRKFEYVYDFGDDWIHTVRLLHTWKAEAPPAMPVCLEAVNACPPEDVGGPYGYFDFLEAMSDVSHDYHDEMMEWWGEVFDPKHVDLGAINEALARVKV